MKTAPAVPSYLKDHYWWAYMHPKSDKLWDQAWMVNLILWGHYDALCEAALASIDPTQPLSYLQIACAYGNITTRLTERLAPGSTLDVIDIVPKQLDNMRHKLANPLPHGNPCRTHLMNAEQLEFDSGQFDHALLFFLLHEQPENVRRNTLAEALRVLAPGGKLTIIDFARPRRGHPIWLWLPVLGQIEPFAWDLWRHPVSTWLPPEVPISDIERETFFGGWFQRLVISKAAASKPESV